MVDGGSEHPDQPAVPLAVHPGAYVPTPHGDEPKKSRGLAATVGILIFAVIAVIAVKLLVHTAAVAVVSKLPGSDTNPGPVASVPAASQPATVANPTLPLAATPGDVVKAVEAYRLKAYATGDMSQLENYYASHNDAWKGDYAKIVTQGVRDPNGKVAEVVLISQSNTQIVANVTYHDGLQPDWTMKNTYDAIDGRWYLTGQVGVS